MYDRGIGLGAFGNNFELKNQDTAFHRRTNAGHPIIPWKLVLLRGIPRLGPSVTTSTVSGCFSNDRCGYW